MCILTHSLKAMHTLLITHVSPEQRIQNTITLM